MQRQTRNILLRAIVAAIVVLGGGWLALSWVAKSAFPSETTDVREYGRVLNDWGPSGLVSYFPKAVPPLAQRVRFSALPKILQGGVHIQLRMQLPADEIEGIESGLKEAASRASAGDGLVDHLNATQGKDLSTIWFHTADKPADSARGFPEYYTLYVLSAKDDGGSWNHGAISGTAVSTTLNEVIYWAEAW